MANSKKQKDLLKIEDVIEKLKHHTDQKLLEMKSGLFGSPPSETYKKAINQILKARGYNTDID